MVMVSKFSNFPDELSESDELREFELSGSDCTSGYTERKKSGREGNVARVTWGIMDALSDVPARG